MIGESRRDARTAAGRDAEIHVTVSDAQEEIDDALAAVHDGFVDAGYMEPQPSGRRMHPSYLNPGLTFMIARIDGETVGVISVVSDGPFGLPADRAFAEEIDALRRTAPVCEVGSLTIRAEWRRHTRRIYMRLLAATVRHVWERHADSHIVLAVTPESERFTSNLFGCTTIAPPRPLYGAPAVLLLTDRERLHETYRDDAGPSRRAMRGLVYEEHPPWLSHVRATEPWDPAWVGALVAEQGVSERLGAQIALLHKLCPHPDGISRVRLPVEVAA